MRKLITAIAFASLLLPAASVAIFAADAPAAGTACRQRPPTAGPVTLPKDIVWETDNDEPLIGSEKAIRGGTLNVAIDAYPLTFRLMGPNSNDSFAAWNRAFTMAFGLVGMHPVTDKFIPIMATHWSIQTDQKTIYFKLDPDAQVLRWGSDHRGRLCLHLEDDAVKVHRRSVLQLLCRALFQSVDKIDDHTLRIVGTRPSWRPLVDYAGLFPTPSHATVLDDTWVTRTTNEPQVAVGPYVVSNVERGASVTLKRNPNWWGDKKRYFIGMYNFDEIHLRVIPARTGARLSPPGRGRLDVRR